MKRFRFGLEALARVYASDQERKQRALAQAQRRQREVEETIVRLGVDYDHCQEEESLRRAAGESVVQMRFFVQYAFDVKRRIEEQKKALLERIREADKARKALLESARRLKALENLKARRLGEWRKERSRWERAFTDEVNQLRFARALPSDA
jgi:flagellar export protein FliJ